MTFDPTKKATPIVIQDDLRLKAIAQMEQVYRRSVEDLTPGKFLTIIGGELEKPLTVEQFQELYLLLTTKYGFRSVETMFDAAIPDYGDDYVIDLETSVNLIPKGKAA